MSKNYALFTDCISEISKTEIDHSKDNDVAMPVYNYCNYNIDHSDKRWTSYK